ncbi:MAG TPA: DUF2190 family protein [Candidatus Scybalomonas excrementigallinarum]|nr:DUF2190 family protein [Candidatus Scybalomonas excrementigallinarum]
MAVYEYATINTSSTITAESGGELGDVRGKAVKFVDGKVQMPGAGEDSIGIVLLSESENVKTGNTVTIQVKDIGKWKAGAAVGVGDLLTSDAEGLCQKATEGQYVLARALSAATAKNDLVTIQIINAGYLKAGA